MAKPLRCLLRVHKWQPRTAEDGRRYLKCSRCGKEDEAGERWVGTG